MDYYNHWIPACAGMTGVVDSGLSVAGRYQATQNNEISGMPKSPNNASVVIPAKAGIQQGEAGVVKG